MAWAYLRKEQAGQRAHGPPEQYFLPSFGLETGTTQRLVQPNVQHFFAPGQVSSFRHLWKQDCFQTALGQSPFLPVAKKGDSHKKEREREVLVEPTGVAEGKIKERKP